MRNFGHGMEGALLEVSFHLMVDIFYTPLCGMWWTDPRKVLLVFPLPLAFPINRGRGAASTLILALTYTCHLMLSGSLSSSHEKSFCRAERLSVFRWELVLDGEALPDR